MSELRIVVREAERDWSGTVHGSCTDCAVAALSADPVTMDELEAAVKPFISWPSSEGKYFTNLSPGLCDEPYDAGLVVIDLVARLVVIDSSDSSPARRGSVWRRDKDGKERRLGYHLADDWFFSSDGEGWRGLAERRRRERLGDVPLDARAVFYGRPLLEYIARESLAAFARRGEIETAVRAEWADAARTRLAKELKISPDEVDANLLTDEACTPKTWPGSERYASLFYDTLKDIHATWLLTARDDLRGESPRDVMFQRLDHISADLNDRCQYWSLVGQCPPGLDRSSHAFRYAGFGTHEMVEYYELVRELLWSCWERLEELSRLPNAAQRPESFLPGDFLTQEVPRLERARDQWLDAPDPELHGRTPRSVIDRERARLPEGLSGHEAMIDHDCPLCQMMADESFGPTFWHLDGCNMDDDFAFDIYRCTREEWEEEQREREAFSRKMDAEWAERERLGVSYAHSGEDESDSVWKRSFSVGDSADLPLGIRVFGIGGHLAELIVGLRGGAEPAGTPAQSRQWIDQLNRDFGTLREVLHASDASLAEALIEPALERFVDSLESVAEGRPELAERCDDLVTQLRRLLDPPPSAPDWSETGNDVPF